MSLESEFNPLLILLDEFKNTGDDKFNPLLILLDDADNTSSSCSIREDLDEMCARIRRGIKGIFQGCLQGKKRKTSVKRPSSERLVDETSKDEPSVFLVPPSKQSDIQDKTVSQCETVISEDGLASPPVCVTLLSGDTQTAMNDILGIPENPCPSVTDQLPFVQCPIMGRLTPGDSNSLFPNSPTSDIVDEEGDKPFLVFDDGLIRSSDLKSEASLDISINCLPEITQHSTDTCSSNRGPPFIATCPPLGEERMFASFACDRPCNVGARKTGAWESEADPLDTRATTISLSFISLSFPRHGPDQASNYFIGNDQDSERVKAVSCALSFPRPGPDQGTNCNIDTDRKPFGLKTALLALAFPRHGPDITFAACFHLFVPLQHAIAQRCYAVPPVRPTPSVRIAGGREAYGKLRPVRRPWF